MFSASSATHRGQSLLSTSGSFSFCSSAAGPRTSARNRSFMGTSPRFLLDRNQRNETNRVMNSRKTVRKSVALPNSRWAAYAVAGAATSLAGLASAEAEIHYSGHIDHQFTGSNHASFPLQDGARLQFSHQLRGPNNKGFAQLALVGSGGPSDSIGYFAGKPNNPTSGFGFYVFRLASHHAITRNSMGRSCFNTCCVVRGRVRRSHYPNRVWHLWRVPTAGKRIYRLFL